MMGGLRVSQKGLGVSGKPPRQRRHHCVHDPLLICCMRLPRSIPVPLFLRVHLNSGVSRRHRSSVGSSSQQCARDTIMKRPSTISLDWDFSLCLRCHVRQQTGRSGLRTPGGRRQGHSSSTALARSAQAEPGRQRHYGLGQHGRSQHSSAMVRLSCPTHSQIYD